MDAKEYIDKHDLHEWWVEPDYDSLAKHMESYHQAKLKELREAVTEAANSTKNDHVFESMRDVGKFMGIPYGAKELPNAPVSEIEEIISEVEDMYPYKEAGNADSYSKYNEGWSDACDELGEKIKKAIHNLVYGEKKGGEG